MFGEKIDYHILRPFTHSRNRATEEELDEKARHTIYSLEDAHTYLDRSRLENFGGRLPVDPNLSYLDVGCGNGRLSIGLGLAGAKNVTGIDIIARDIEEACAWSQSVPIERRPKFLHVDIHQWDPEEKFDVVIVLGAMEHIHDPGDFLKLLPRLLKSTGKAFVSIEPFQSMFGDHLSGFFWLPIPWKGLLFSEKALLRLRKEKYRPTDPATRFPEIVGGLNQLRYEDYIRLVYDAGLEFVSHNCNPRIHRRFPYLPLATVSRALTSIPGVRGYFIHADYSILQLRSS